MFKQVKARTKLVIAAAGVVATLAFGSFALAAIPDTDGTIHGCYDKASGALRVTDPVTKTPKACTSKELALEWKKGALNADAFGTDTGNAAAGDGVMCTMGQIILSAAAHVTAGGIPADGRLLSIAQNTALFALLGNTYGGDGRTTFAVPDLRPITPNHMTYSVCDMGVFPSIR
jgi:hypothetical protein